MPLCWLLARLRAPMLGRDLAAAAAGAAVAASVTLWLTRCRRRRAGRAAAVEPVLCFGDSLTEGYFNIWQHPVFGPSHPDDPTQEMARLRFHPYSIQLGARLAADAGEAAVGYAAGLRYAAQPAHAAPSPWPRPLWPLAMAGRRSRDSA